MNLYLLLAAILGFTLAFGKILEKVRIPWVFAALFLGLIASFFEVSAPHQNPEIFNFLSDLGIYSLLFMIGLELNLKELKKQSGFILKLSGLLILSETILGSLFIHSFFQTSWTISILTATSFATVGEAILIPILEEFNLIQTKFGQTLLGVGTLDDIVELMTLIAFVLVLGNSEGYSSATMTSNLLYLFLLILIPVGLQIFSKKISHFHFKRIPAMFLFGFIILFAFVGIGDLVESASLGAILAGISLKNILDKDKLEQFEKAIQTTAYGLFVPIFFFVVGSHIDLNYLYQAPLLIILTLTITNSSKILSSLAIGHKSLGKRKSILLGIGLSAKFSTSIVIISLLLEQNLISTELYSVLIGSMIVSKFIIPISFTYLLQKWDLKFTKLKTSN